MSRKRVTFSEIEIIELPYIVGDGPASEGTPVGLGWEPVDRSCFNINFFESFRPPRRTKPSLRMSPEKRKSLLLRNGHSLREINRGAQEAMKFRQERAIAIRQQRRILHAQMKPVAPVAA